MPAGKIAATMRRPSPPSAVALVVLLAPLAGLCWGLGTARPARALASPWQENPQSRVRLISPYETAPRNGTLWLGIQLTLSPGWHVYWKNSGDAGFPPDVDLSATPELGDVELQFPAPHRYELPGDLVAFGYDEEVVYPLRATIAASGEHTVEIAVDLGYLVCEVDCVPHRYTLTIEQPVGADPVPDPDTAKLLDRWRGRVPRPVAEVAGVSTDAVLDVSDLAHPVLLVTVDGVHPPADRPPEIFFEHHELFELGTPVLEQGASSLRFRVPLTLRRHLDEAPPTSVFAWTVTGIGRGRGAPEAIEARRAVPARLSPPAAEEPPVSVHRSRGWLAGSVALGFLGGLLLALTPGALALLLAFLGGFRALAGSGERRALPLGLGACAGAVGAAVGLALLALAQRAGEPAAPWGAHLAEPTAVTALALLSLAVALWLWGLLGDAGGRLAPARLGTGPAALAGVLATLLALPWPVPPVPDVIERALGSAPALLLTSAALGLGLGIPWLVGAVLCDRRAALPVPHPEGRGREILGFVAVLPVLWLLYLLSATLRTEYLAFVELALLGMALLSWARQRAVRRSVRALCTLALLVLVIGTVWLADRGRLRARLDSPEEALRRAETASVTPPPPDRPPGVG